MRLRAIVIVPCIAVTMASAGALAYLVLGVTATTATLIALAGMSAWGLYTFVATSRARTTRRERPGAAERDGPHPLTAPAALPPTKPTAKTAVAADETARDTTIPSDDPLATIRSAIDDGRIDIHLQPIVTLPRRKVRYYEALARLRTDAGDTLAAAEFMPEAQHAGLAGAIDNLVVFRCVQVARRLLLTDRDVGIFCNISARTLTDHAAFQPVLDFLDANRVVAPSIILEFTHSTLRAAGAAENDALAALADRGFWFSLDNLQDLRIDPRDLAARGIRFIKAPARLLLDPAHTTGGIDPEDVSDLLGRFGIELIADKVETEATVIDLLDRDVRFGQGFLFSPPLPLRADVLQGIPGRRDKVAAGRN